MSGAGARCPACRIHGGNYNGSRRTADLDHADSEVASADVVHSAFPHSVHACARCGSFEALCSLLEARDRSPRACLVLPVSQPLHRARASLFPPHLPIASSLSSPPASHLRLPVSADRPVLKPWSDSEPRSTSRVPRYAYRSDGTQKTTTSKNDPQPPLLPPPTILDLPAYPDPICANRRILTSRHHAPDAGPSACTTGGRRAASEARTRRRSAALSPGAPSGRCARRTEIGPKSTFGCLSLPESGGPTIVRVSGGRERCVGPHPEIVKKHVCLPIMIGWAARGDAPRAPTVTGGVGGVGTVS